MALGPTPDVVRPVAYVPSLVPHQAGRADPLLHDALEALPVGRAVAVHVEVATGAVQPLFILRRQLAGERRQ